MSAFEAGDFVVKVIDIHGMQTATIQRVESVARNVVAIKDSHATYRADTGAEIDPVIPGCRSCRSYLVAFDYGEPEIWGLESKAGA